MYIIDTHCDLLWKLQQKKRQGLPLNFKDDPTLQVNLQRLKMGRVQVQCFAIFVHDHVPDDEKWQHVLEQVDIFHEVIVQPNQEIKHIRNWQELTGLKPNQIAAVLTIEGLDPIGNDLMKLRHLIRLGVLAVGLTWNQANLCADGIGERRGAGLTTFGEQVIATLNKNKIMTDISHLSDAAADAVISLADYPFASHSNSRSIYPHRRNLTDRQAKALFAKKAMIHLNFYPPFFHQEANETILSHWLQHVAHFCAIGGADFIGIGSDFDGMDMVASDMSHAGMYPQWVESLLRYHPRDQVRKITSENFLAYIERFA